MRFPVGNTGSLEEFNSLWYVASGFGVNRGTYFHEGADVNLRTGGDTDLNQELKAIADGKITHFHYGSHPTVKPSFGRHIVERIEGAWGVRWSMFSHCGEQDFINSTRDVTKGQIIARIGKSGTDDAHLHWSLFKVDPITIGGIDVLARTWDQLQTWWEDPVEFVKKWMVVTVPQPTPEITWQTRIPQILDSQGNPMEVQAINSKLNDQERDLLNLNKKIEQIKTIIG